MLKKLMVSDDYAVAAPVPSGVMSDLLQTVSPVEWEGYKKAVYGDIQKLLISRQDYAHLFVLMDGLEYNGLTIYNLTQSENGIPVWSNIYTQNMDARSNDIYEDLNLTDKVIFGEDGMSLFTYNFSDDTFEIRDRVATDYIIESYRNFNEFLSAVVATVS